MKTYLITLTDEDEKWFLQYVEKAKEDKGTVGGLTNGLMSSVMRDAIIKRIDNETEKIL